MLPNLKKFKVLAPQQMGIEDKNGLSQDNQKCLVNAIQMAQKWPLIKFPHFSPVELEKSYIYFFKAIKHFY